MFKIKVWDLALCKEPLLKYLGNRLKLYVKIHTVMYKKS